MNIYIVRHGFPDYALDCLTDLGHEQAEAAADALEAVGIDEIYSSPMGRARETAKHLADRIGKPITIEPWAHELTVSGFDSEFFRSPELIALGDAWVDHPRFAGDNSVRAVIDEVSGGVNDLMRRQGYAPDGERWRALDPERSNDKNIALFCHVGVFSVISAYLLRVPLRLAWGMVSQYAAAYSVCALDTNAEGFAVAKFKAVNVYGHLAARGLRLS